VSNRFHNKFHRHNHHTTSTGDLRYPDAAYDPIASRESPFRGEFYSLDNITTTQNLSARETTLTNNLYVYDEARIIRAVIDDTYTQRLAFASHTLSAESIINLPTDSTFIYVDTPTPTTVDGFTGGLDNQTFTIINNGPATLFFPASAANVRGGVGIELYSNEGMSLAVRTAGNYSAW
jgi:hypothetical protein